MSDDHEIVQRQDAGAATAATEWVALCPHTEAAGTRWGDEISDARKDEIDAGLREWEAGSDDAARQGPFQHLRLTGADVFYLAGYAIAKDRAAVRGVQEALLAPRRRVSALPLAGIDAEDIAEGDRQHAASSDLLKSIFGSEYTAVDAAGTLYVALPLKGATLEGAHLEGARLRYAHLEGARLTMAHLDGADLALAHLERARLAGASLTGALLTGAHLEGAQLREGRLEGARLSEAHLAGADLREAFLDTGTLLRGATVSGPGHGRIRVADTRWGGVNLAALAVGLAPPLGDEEAARKERGLEAHHAAVRANRQLAVALRSQGMQEEADRFAYRAQRLQREVLLRQRRYIAWAGSAILDGLAGYGYKPARALLVYLAMIVGFAATYYLIGPAAHLPLSSLEALVFSVTSFHGRGFSPGANVTLANPLTVLAAAEAVLGLLVEITFIATFTQRFFGSK